VFTDFTPTSIDASTLDLTKGNGELVAINVNTGNILWSKMFNSTNVGAATVVNDVVFTATFDGTIYGFRTTTGEQLFNYSAPAGINGWPAVAGNMIVWPAGVGADGSVIALSTTPKGGGGIPIEYIAGIAAVIIVVVIAAIALAGRRRKTVKQ